MKPLDYFKKLTGEAGDFEREDAFNLNKLSNNGFRLFVKELKRFGEFQNKNYQRNEQRHRKGERIRTPEKKALDYIAKNWFTLMNENLEPKQGITKNLESADAAYYAFRNYEKSAAMRQIQNCHFCGWVEYYGN